MTCLSCLRLVDISRDLILLICLFVFIAASIGAKHSRMSYYKWLALVIGGITGLILTGLSLQGMAKSIATSGPLGFFSTIFTLGPVLSYLYEGVIAAAVFGVVAHIIVEFVRKIQPHMPHGIIMTAIVCLSLLLYSPYSLTRRQMQMQNLLEQNQHHVDVRKPEKVRKN